MITATSAWPYGPIRPRPCSVSKTLGDLAVVLARRAQIFSGTQPAGVPQEGQKAVLDTTDKIGKEGTRVACPTAAGPHEGPGVERPVDASAQEPSSRLGPCLPIEGSPSSAVTGEKDRRGL